MKSAFIYVQCVLCHTNICIHLHDHFGSFCVVLVLVLDMPAHRADNLSVENSERENPPPGMTQIRTYLHTRVGIVYRDTAN